MNSEEYSQQLLAINQLLKQCPEGNERSELLSLKHNIEELLSLTKEETELSSEEDETVTEENTLENENHTQIDDEYELFMAEMAKEGAVEVSNTNSTNENHTVLKTRKSLKHLEGKKFRAPHKHQWGQMVYHNAMVCSVPDEIPPNNEFQVKVLFLNPTHKEMQPCPYYFHLEKNCNFTEEECGFSHGEAVLFSSLQEYIEPKFELLTIGSDVLAKQSNSLWYRAKIVQIFKEKCLVRFDSKNIENQSFEDVIFSHILPMETSENNSDNESDSNSDIEVVREDFEVQLEKDRRELILNSMMTAPESQKMGDWEKYTKGIGSKLMQKMGYIVGTGLGKKGGGIIKPVTAVILPQGKSLDYCMNLKEKRNNPDLFSADQSNTKRRKTGSKRKRHLEKRAKKRAIRVELMDLTNWPYTDEQEYQLLRDKLKSGSDKDVNIANFMIEEKLKKCVKNLVDLKATIKRLEDVHADTHKLLKKLSNRESDLKRFNTYKMMIKNEIDRRKNNKEMAVF